MTDPTPGDADHAWVDFEGMVVEVDGEVLPITHMLTRAGLPAQGLHDCALVFAGRPGHYVSMRMLPAGTVH